jgi:hypothetical protein
MGRRGDDFVPPEPVAISNQSHLQVAPAATMHERSKVTLACGHGKNKQKMKEAWG